MTRIFMHPLAGVLSAYGMGLADQIAMREASVEQPLDAAGLAAARERLAELGRAASDELVAQGVPAQAVQRRADAAPALPGHRHRAGACRWPTWTARARPSRPRYRQRFAFLMPDRPLVIEAVSVEAIGPGERFDDAGAAPTAEAHDARGRRAHAHVLRSRRARCRLARRRPVRARTAARRRTHRRPGDHCRGQRHHGGRARLAGAGVGVPARWSCSARVPRVTRHAIGTEADPVMLEVFNNLFMNIAEQMGLRLQNTAYSVNIKERLDFSCALFSAAGELIANAPHMPVHLGSMSESDQDGDRSATRRCAAATCTCSTIRTTAARTCPT